MKPLFGTSKSTKERPLGHAAEQRLLWARILLLYERLWPRAWPLIGLVLAFAGLAWFDVWRVVPGYVHGLLLLPFMALAGAALWHLARGFHWPTREEGMARLEKDSGLSHAPLQALSDSLALGRKDPASEALWRAHLRRAASALENIRLKPPRPDVPQADPFALRVIAVAFALLGLLYAGPDWQARLSSALVPDLAFKSGDAIAVDAWVTPPAYTQKPPLFLARAEPGAPIPKVTVPEGSVMSVRVAGAQRAPHIRRHIKSSGDAPKNWRASLTMNADGAKSYKIELPLEVDASVDVLAGQRKLGRWDITLVPDLPPTVALKEPIGANEKNLLSVAFKASDDYGVATAELHIEPAQPAEVSGPDRDLAIANATEPLIVPLSLPTGRQKAIDTKQLIDLTAHPWAGLRVTLTLAATDEAGQTGLSAPQTITLPERQFNDPLARAIIEQRRILAAAPRANRERVREALDALTLAPERFTPDFVVYLGLRTAYFRLDNELTKDALQSVYDLFWNLALHIEDGDLTLAEQALREIQNKLMSALAGDASDQEIQQLMAQLKDALGRYMQALEEQARKAIAQGRAVPAMTPDGNTVTSQDFQDLMQAIEEMARTGARGAARDMLAQLQDILNNLKIGDPNAQMTQSEQAMSQALKELEDIVKEQKNLLDETYRQSGDGAPPEQDDRSAAALSRDQAELREQLGRLKGELGQNMPTGLEPFDRAGEAMGKAQDSLGARDAAGAVPHETRAIQELQRGMQGLAQALAQSLGGRLSVGSQGEGRDPLGRRRGGMGAISDDSVKVPEEMQLQRARRIQQEIQRRASDPNRERKELDYLERLLKRF